MATIVDAPRFASGIAHLIAWAGSNRKLAHATGIPSQRIDDYVRQRRAQLSVRYLWKLLDAADKSAQPSRITKLVLGSVHVPEVPGKRDKIVRFQLTTATDTAFAKARRRDPERAGKALVTWIARDLVEILERTGVVVVADRAGASEGFVPALVLNSGKQKGQR